MARASHKAVHENPVRNRLVERYWTIICLGFWQGRHSLPAGHKSRSVAGHLVAVSQSVSLLHKRRGPTLRERVVPLRSV